MREISWVSLWRILIFIVLVAILYMGRQIILGLFLAIIISSGLEGLVNILERARLPRSVSVIFIFLVIMFVITLAVYSVLPLIIIELRTILSPGAISATAGSGTIGVLSGLASSALNSISSQFSATAASPLSFFSNALGSVGLAVAVILCSFYLSLTKDGVERFLKVVIPPDFEERALGIYESSRRLISSWFRTQILLSLIMGFTVWGGLTILGVKYAFLIACLAGLFELVPFVGPFLSGAIAVVSALSTSTTLAVYTLIFFILAQQLEANVLVPLLSQRIVGLHPVIVIVALLIGATIGGFLGIVIAVPVAGVFQEVIQDWSSKKRTLTAT